METKLYKYFFIVVLGIFLSFSSKSQDTYLLNSTTHNQVITTCNAILYDSGGPTGNYSNSEDYVITFCSPIPGIPLNVELVSFNSESTTYDYMHIYNGTSAVTANRIVGPIGGRPAPQQGNTYTTTGECVHIVWHTDGSSVYAGFEIHITCDIPCQDFSFAATPASPSALATIYKGNSLNFGVNGTYPSSGTYYDQSNDNVIWTWSIVDPNRRTTESSGVGLTEITHNFDRLGTYYISVTAIDVLLCEVTVNNMWVINVNDQIILNGQTNGQTFNTCQGSITDSGGESGPHGTGENYTLILCSDFEGSIPQLNFTEFDLAPGAYLTVYDGIGTSGTVLLNQAGGNTIPQLTTGVEECITIVWHSGPATPGTGFFAEVSCQRLECQSFSIDITSTDPSLSSLEYIVPLGTTVDFVASGLYPNQGTYTQNNGNVTWIWEFHNGIMPTEIFDGVGLNNLSYNFEAGGEYTIILRAIDGNACEAEPISITVSVPNTFNLNNSLHQRTITTCGATLYDSGGPNNNYGNSEDYVVTFCSPIPGVSLSVELIMFNSESTSFDYMTIYDGTSISSPALTGRIGGRPAPEQGNIYTTTGECVHFVWHTDGSGLYPGFEIGIDCNIPCQDYTIDITSTTPTVSNNSEININTVVDFLAEGLYPNNGVIYNQSDENIKWSWEIITPSRDTLIHQGLGNNFLNYAFDEDGVYTLTLSAVDINECRVVLPTWSINVLPVYLIDVRDGNTIYACHGTIYDSGGAQGNYGLGEDYSITVCSDFPGSILHLDFTSFDVSNNAYITIYDGIGTSGNILLNQASGNRPPPQTTATGECMTLVWHSNNSGTAAAGFAAEISCTPPPCQDFNAAFENTEPYLPTLNYIVSQGTTVNFIGQGIYPNQNLYPQNNETSIWHWEFNNGSVDVIEGLGLSSVNYIFSTPGNYIVTLTITDANNCESNSVTMNVTVSQQNILRPPLAGTTVTTCATTLYDSGGPDGNYGNNEDYVITYCNPAPGGTINIELEEFNSESTTYDYMHIYNGTSAVNANRIVGPIGGRPAPEQGRTYTTTEQCAHLVWHTDGSGLYAGFKINITCNMPCQDYTINFASTNPSISNNSQIYINTNLAFVATGTFPNNGQYYNQDDSNLNWIWEITLPNGRTETINRLGISMINYDFDQGGEYKIRVSSRDIYGCEAISEYWTIIVLPVYLIDEENNRNTINACIATIYDSGGESGNYSDNEDYMTTFCSDIPGARLRLDFVGFDLARGDHLTIYDGTSNYGLELLPETTGSRIPRSITSTGECLTIQFHSDASTNKSGFEIELVCIPPECQDFVVYIVESQPDMPSRGFRALEGSTVSFTGRGTYTSSVYEQSDETSYWEWTISGNGILETFTGYGLTSISYTFAQEGEYDINITVTDANNCSTEVNNPMTITVINDDNVVRIDPSTNGTTIRDCGFMLYDSGGPNGDYSNNENYSVTICNPNTTGLMAFNILSFNSEAGNDYMNIYDGVGTTGTTLLNRASGARVAPARVVSTQQCATITWYSNYGTINSGFEIYVDCVNDCQDFSITFPAYPEGDTLPIDVCKNTIIPFQINGVYPENNTHYYQADENIIWEWQVEGTEVFKIAGRGMNVFEYQFNKPGGYFVNVVGTDTNGCKHSFSNSVLHDKFVRVALDPDFSGTRITDTVCPGYVVDMMGFYEVEPWQYTYEIEVIDTVCMGDDMYRVEQIYRFTQEGFEDGATITSVDDIESIVIQMEHSYIGDLDLFIRCPGDEPRREMSLISYPNGCGSAYLGEPIDDDSRACEWGVPYYYTWAPDATTTLSSACSGFGSRPVPSQELAPEDPWTNLIGCPLNGDWEIVVIDNLRSDDGTVFSVGFSFADHIYQNHSTVLEWSYTNTYSNFSWSGAGVNSNGVRATAIPTVSGDQAYTFSMKDNFNCMHDTTLYVHVRPVYHPDCCITPEASAGPSLDTLVCSDKFQFRASLASGNTGRWTVVDKPLGAPDPVIYGPTSPNARVEVLQNGSYEFQWTEYYAGVQSCFDSDIIRVEFRTRPTSVFSNPPILCYGDTITFTYRGNIDEFTTANYHWEFSGGRVINGSGRNPYNVFWENEGTYDVSLRVSAYGCESDVTTITLTNPPEMKYELTLQDNTCYNSCDGKARISVVGGTYPYRYSWASPTSVLNNICAGDYTITVTDRNGCFVSEEFTIEHPAELKIIDTDFTNLTCYNSNDGEMMVKATGGTGEYTYIWSDIGAADSLRTNVPAGRYTVVVKDENGCSVSTVFTLTQPDELVTIVSSDINLCQGASTFIEANTVGGVLPYLYNWKKGEEPYFTTGDFSLFEIPEESITYSVYVTDANGCTGNIASMNVTVSPTLVIDSLVIRDNRCNTTCDGRAEIHLSGGIPPFRYSWDSDNYVYDGLCAGIYSVSVTDLLGCKISAPFTINEPEPIVHYPTMIPATCYGYSDGSTKINVSGGTPPYSYLWPEGEDTHTLTALAGTYTVTVLDANNCRIEVAQTIEQPSKMIVIPVLDRTICIGETTRITTEVSGGTPNYEFVWTDNGTNIYSKVIEVTPDVATTYTLQIHDANGCTTTPITTTVNIYPELKINSVLSSNNMNCPGDSVLIEVNVTGGNGGPYYMTLQDGSIVGSSFWVTPMVTTTYYMTLEDMCDSPNTTDSITINVRPTPIGDFLTNDVTGCPPFSVVFEESSLLEFDYYIWRFGDGGYSEERYPIYTFNETGSFDISLEVRDDFGCKHIKTIKDYIRVLPTPKASFEMTPNLLTFDSKEIQFSNYSTDAENYYWSFGDGDSSLYMNPKHEYRDLREYEITLIAENEFDCRDTITKKLGVNERLTFYMPNSFTPNGDGVNDCFRPCGTGISPDNFKLVVQDRWGNIVYSTTKYNPEASCTQCSDGGWDGTQDRLFKSSREYLPNGSYIWVCEFQDLDGLMYRKEGSVTLIR